MGQKIFSQPQIVQVLWQRSVIFIIGSTVREECGEKKSRKSHCMIFK